MSRVASELIFAVLAIAAITAGYVWLAQDGIPRPNSWIGYGLGITGFLLMLSAETLYSLRKRLTGFHLGPMSTWLQLHVFAGLVGPYLVLLHAGWRFHGLAGVLTLVTVMVVLSGLVGRYIYTAVPRDVEGAARAVLDLEAQIAEKDGRLRKLGVSSAELGLVAESPRRGWVLVLARPVLRWRQKRQVRQAIQKLDSVRRQKAVELEQLLTERQRLLWEMDSLEATRRLLALWHVFHIPLSAALFALAFIHIGVALYYAALAS
jgi:hypothetical protein